MALALALVGIVFGTTTAGIYIGRQLRRRRDGLEEPLGVVQAALVGFVALLLAFGLTMAVGRYEARRNALVDEANTIGTTYLRAQTLPEPVRGESLQLLRDYTDRRVALTHSVPDSAKFRAASQRSLEIQRELWRLAGQALDRQPTYTAPRLYPRRGTRVTTRNDERAAGRDRPVAARPRPRTRAW